MVAEEHELAAGTKQPVRLADPGHRFTPDRRTVLADREVERAVWLGDRLGVAMYAFDVVESVEIAQAPPVANWASELSMAYTDAPRRRIHADT
jgi:hypothetical protein